MELDALLLEAETEVLDAAYSSLHGSHVTHYELAGEEFTRQALADLFRLVVTAIQTRDLASISSYADAIAVARFNNGYDISEVQMAFNALEDAMWRRVVSAEPPSDLAEAIGLLSTVLGYGKDAVARKYLSLACKRHIPTLDLSALFAGASS
jgi:hypothetical protein